MKVFILMLALSFSTIAFSQSKESALEVVKLNESVFSQKELLTKPDLCKFHREMQEKAELKETISCPRSEGSSTRDDEVALQLNQINKMVDIPNQGEPQSVDDLIIRIPKRIR